MYDQFEKVVSYQEDPSPFDFVDSPFVHVQPIPKYVARPVYQGGSRKSTPSKRKLPHSSRSSHSSNKKSSNIRIGRGNTSRNQPTRRGGSNNTPRPKRVPHPLEAYMYHTRDRTPLHEEEEENMDIENYVKNFKVGEGREIKIVRSNMYRTGRTIDSFIQEDEDLTIWEDLADTMVKSRKYRW